jgi:TatD DNase family protein
MTELRPLDLHAHPVEAGNFPIDKSPAVLAVTFTPEQWSQRSQPKDPRGLVWGLGLHPWDYEDEAQLFHMLANIGNCDAVGEVGLDGSPWARLPMARQREALAAILDHAETKKRLVSVHGWLAYIEVVELLEAHPTPGVIYHWFMGMDDTLRRAVNTDIYFSVNHNMFSLPEGRAVIADLPRERVVIETDAPYIERATGDALSPGDDLTGDRPLKPGEVELTERDLANLWSTDPMAVREQIWRNLAELEARISHRPFSAVEKM